MIRLSRYLSRVTCLALGLCVSRYEPVWAQCFEALHHVGSGGAKPSQPSSRLKAAGDSSETAWHELASLAPRTPLIVNTDTDIDLKGRFVAAYDDRLDIAGRGQDVRALSRSVVRHVRLERPRRSGRWMALGMAVGAVTGYLAGSAAACDSAVCGGEGGLVIAGTTTYGVTLGIIGGFVAGQADHLRPGRLIYERPPSSLLFDYVPPTKGVVSCTRPFDPESSQSLCCSR